MDMDYIHYATYHPYLDMGHARRFPHPISASKAFPHGVSLGTTGMPTRTVAGHLLDLERANFPSKYERRADLDRIRSKRRVEDFKSIPQKSYADYLTPTNTDRVYISPWSSVFPSHEDYFERPIRRYPVRPVRQVGLGLPGSFRCLGLRREDQDLDPLTIEVEAEQVRMTADREARRLHSAMWQSAATDRVIRQCQERNRYREQEKRLENARLVAPIYQSPDSHLGIRQIVLINYHKGAGGGSGDVHDTSHPSPLPEDISTKVTVPLKRRRTLEELEASAEPAVDATVIVESSSAQGPSAEDAVEVQELILEKQDATVEENEQLPESTPTKVASVEEPPASAKKSAKGKVPPKLSILKTKKSESVEEEPKTPTKVKTPKEAVMPKTPIREAPASPIPIIVPITPTEPDVPQSPINEAPPTPKTPVPALQSPLIKEIPQSPISEAPLTPKTPISTPQSPLISDVPQSPINEAPPSPKTPISIPQTPTESEAPKRTMAEEPINSEQEDEQIEIEPHELNAEVIDDTVKESEFEDKTGPLATESLEEKKTEEQDENERCEESASPPPAPLRRLVSNVSNKEGESCDPEEWVDDDPPSIEIETDESRPRVILSASDVPSAIAKIIADEEENDEYVSRPAIQTEEPSNEDEEINVEGSDGRNMGSLDRLTSENAELLSVSTNDNENAEAGSAITGDATEGTISANSRPLSIDAESLIADEEQPIDDGINETKDDEDAKMTVEEPDEVTLKSEGDYERTKSLSIEEQSDEE